MTLPANSKLFALVPAAGIGERMGAGMPKQYLTLQGKTLAEHTMGRLLSFARIQKVVVAIASSDPWWPQLNVSRHKRVLATEGGDSRARSVLNGLKALLDDGGADAADWVLVHDMARPCLRLSDLEKLISETQAEGALLALPVSDTIKQSNDDDCAEATLNRDHVWRALTPQLFCIGDLVKAIESGLASGLNITDESSAMEALGKTPKLVAGQSDNIKITHPDDLALARFYLARQEEEGLLWQSV